MTAVARPPVIVANAKPPVQRKPKGPGPLAHLHGLKPPPHCSRTLLERKWTGREDEILISAVGKYSQSISSHPVPRRLSPPLHYSRRRKDKLDKDRRTYRGTIEQGLSQALDPLPQSHAKKGEMDTSRRRTSLEGYSQARPLLA